MQCVELACLNLYVLLTDVFAAETDFIFLKGDIGGYMQTYYELVDLEHSKD